MKKQMELIQRVLLDKYFAQSSQRPQREVSEEAGLLLIGAIGMTGWLVLVVGHCV